MKKDKFKTRSKSRSKKRIRAKFIGIFGVFEISLMIFLSIASMSMVFIGYHNADMGQNFRFMEEAYDMDIIDIGLDNVVRQPEDMYILGMKQMLYGAASLCIILCSIFPAWIYLVFEEIKRAKNE